MFVYIGNGFKEKIEFRISFTRFVVHPVGHYHDILLDSTLNAESEFEWTELMTTPFFLQACWETSCERSLRLVIRRGVSWVFASFTARSAVSEYDNACLDIPSAMPVVCFIFNIFRILRSLQAKVLPTPSVAHTERKC